MGVVSFACVGGSCSLLAMTVAPSKSTPGNAFCSCSRSASRFSIGRCWRLGSVDEIDKPAPRDRHHVIGAIEHYPEEPGKTAAHSRSGTNLRVGRGETETSAPIWLAMSPMPVSPPVSPVGAVPAPSAALGHQFDQRRGAKRDLGRLDRDRSSLYRGGRQCHQPDECRNGHAHFSFYRDAEGTLVGGRLTGPKPPHLSHRRPALGRASPRRMRGELLRRAIAPARAPRYAPRRSAATLPSG
jgi:hypothetical protein